MKYKYTIFKITPKGEILSTNIARLYHLRYNKPWCRPGRTQRSVESYSRLFESLIQGEKLGLEITEAFHGTLAINEEIDPTVINFLVKNKYIKTVNRIATKNHPNCFYSFNQKIDERFKITGLGKRALKFNILTGKQKLIIEALSKNSQFSQLMDKLNAPNDGLAKVLGNLYKKNYVAIHGMISIDEYYQNKKKLEYPEHLPEIISWLFNEKTPETYTLKYNNYL